MLDFYIGGLSKLDKLDKHYVDVSVRNVIYNNSSYFRIDKNMIRIVK